MHSSIDSHSKSLNGMSKKENYFNCFDSFTSPFLMTMPIMATGTTSVEGQLAETTLVIAKLTTTVEEKDMQIVSLINKVETQVHNTNESIQGLNHLSNVTSPLNDAPRSSRIMQVGKQMIESASVASLSVQEL